MKKFLLTRSRVADYQFVGEQPDNRWWTAFSTVTNFERPSILVDARSAPTWRAYVTAMQSKRRDRVGTLIRYSLALEGGKEDAAGLRSLVAAWLAPGGGTKLAASLDERFPEAELERWLEPDGAPDPSDVRGRLDAFYKELEEASEFDADGEVMGGTVVPADDVKLFLHAITEISGGEYDVLLVSSSRDAAGLGTDVALLDRSWMAIDRGGKHHEKKKDRVQARDGLYPSATLDSMDRSLDSRGDSGGNRNRVHIRDTPASEPEPPPADGGRGLQMRNEGAGRVDALDELNKISAELGHAGRDAARLVKDGGKVLVKAAGSFMLEMTLSGIDRLLQKGDDADSAPKKSRKGEPPK